LKEDLSIRRMASRPRRRSGIDPVALDDEIIAFDSAAASLHHLNAAASVFWSECDGIRTLGEIARAMATRSCQPLAMVEAQLLELVDGLLARGLLELDRTDG
jgi:coenzyme PQQ synthesis protein D (PqqD)